MTDGPAAEVVSAFTEDQVSQLTGITVGRLRYWDRTGFFQPSFGAENRRVPFSRIYSFRDVVALRVLAVLIHQHNVPLQELRRVSERLGAMDNSVWARTTLYALNRKVIFVGPEDGRPREVVSGQYMIGIPLERVTNDTRRDIRNLSTRGKDQLGQVERHRRVSHNAEVVAGTRIPVRSVREFLHAGYSPAQIVREYPSLTAADVEAIARRDRAA